LRSDSCGQSSSDIAAPIVEEIIRVVHVIKDPSTYSPRSLIIAEEGSSLTVIEELIFLDEVKSSLPSVTEIILAPSANCSYTRIVNGSPTLKHLGAVLVSAEKDSKLQSFFLQTDGDLVRTEISASLVGERADVRVSGLNLSCGHEVIDTVVTMHHQAPNCQSRQLFKGVYGDSARGSFSGTIVVDKVAQKTNAFQSCKAILLSEDGSVFTKPRLKIWADDVKCSHGATVGQLNEAALFYLRSRGIPEESARILLLDAFVGEVLADINQPRLREVITKVTTQRLERVLKRC
jgi:Fe-S cluster assembly protein SufD